LVKGMTDKVVSAYYSYMVDLAVLFGADRSKAETELKESLNFEMALANVSSFDIHTRWFNPNQLL
jgi:neprilysin